MKVMSILGIIIFSVCIMIVLIGLLAVSNNEDADAIGGYSIIGLLYGLAMSIVGVVKSGKKKN